MDETCIKINQDERKVLLVSNDNLAHNCIGSNSNISYIPWFDMRRNGIHNHDYWTPYNRNAKVWKHHPTNDEEISTTNPKHNSTS